MSGYYYQREAGAEGQILTGEGTAPGTGLDQLLDRQRPPLRAALEIGSAVADLLCIAAEDGAIHGDIRPAHVKVGDNGSVSLEGFGIQRRSTRAPEGRPDTLAVDTYGLGVVLHSMLSKEPLGQLPNDPDGHDDEVVSRVLSMDFSTVQGKRWLEDVRRFLCQILAFYPEDRPQPLDAANVLASVAGQCPGEGLDAWIRRARTAAPARPAARVEEDLGGPVQLTGPFQNQRGAARQAPAAKGQSTSFWSRERIAAMLAEEEDDEPSVLPPPRPAGRGTLVPEAAPERLAPAQEPRSVREPSREAMREPSREPMRESPRDPMREPSRESRPESLPPVSVRGDTSRTATPPRSSPPVSPPPEAPVVATPSRPATPRPAIESGNAGSGGTGSPFAGARIERSVLDDPPEEPKSGSKTIWIVAAVIVLLLVCGGVLTLGGGAALFWRSSATSAVPEAAVREQEEAAEAQKKAAEEAAKAGSDAAKAGSDATTADGSSATSGTGTSGNATPGNGTSGAGASGNATSGTGNSGTVPSGTATPGSATPGTGTSGTTGTSGSSGTAASGHSGTSGSATGTSRPGGSAPSGSGTTSGSSGTASGTRSGTTSPTNAARPTSGTRTSTPTAPATRPASVAPAPAAPAEPAQFTNYTVRFSVSGAEGTINCGDGQRAEFAGSTTMSFEGTTTCLVKVDKSKGTVQVSRNASVNCTVAGDKVMCTGA